MRDQDNERPPEGTPEFEEWLNKRAAKHSKDLFAGEAADFDERGPIFGDIKDLGKSDAELFPDELEEYTPEERRKAFKVHDGDNKDRN